MPWRLAHSLEKLREQIDQQAPGRSKASDGSIGDSQHATRTSDHNPWIQDATTGTTVVSAIDITHDPEHAVLGTQLAHQISADQRVKYVIWDGRIYKSRTGRWESYRGRLNPQRHHVHVSVQPHPDLYDSKDEWSINLAAAPAVPTVPTVPTLPETLRLGDSGVAVRVLQSHLRIQVNGNFDPRTEATVKDFQRTHGLDVDGIVGPKTWGVLYSE